MTTLANIGAFAALLIVSFGASSAPEHDANLLAAFEKAKERSVERALYGGMTYFPILWGSEYAQRSRKRFILHHGTLLYDMDPELMERYLIEPDDRPQYRGQRTHRGFVKCLSLTSSEIRDTFLRAFAAPGTQPDTPTKTELFAVKALAKERFETQDWINRR